MNTLLKLVLIGLFSATAPFITFAASADTIVVVNGNTEVNREAYNYLRKIFAYNKLPYTLTATLNPSSVKPGDYRRVVVLNTGIASGEDPVLKKFVETYPDKNAVYWVNLYRGRTDFTAVPFHSDASTLGVDGVTAASTWRGAWGGPDPQKMHLEWVKDLVNFLGRA